MIRQVLVSTQDASLIALDAALRRGDLLLAKQALWPEAADEPQAPSRSPAIRLRQAAYAYLAGQHHAALQMLETLASPELPAPLICTVHFLRALIHIDLKHPAIVHEALELCQDQDDEAAAAQILPYLPLARATLALYMGDHDGASGILARLSSLDAWQTAQRQRLDGLIAHQTTAYERAQTWLCEARTAFASLGDAYEVARCDKALANTYRRLDDQAQALAHARAAIRYFSVQNLDIPLARCQNTQGAVLLAFNQTEAALDLFKQAADRLESTGLVAELAHTLGNIGLCYRQMGLARLALQAYARARQLVADPHIPYTDAMLAEYQGDLYWLDNQPPQALRTTQEAIHLFAQAGAPLQVALCQRKLGQYLMALNRLHEAEDYLRRSSETFYKEKSPAQSALTALQLGRLYLRQGYHERAAVLLETSAAILRGHGRAHQAAAAEIYRAEIHLAAQEYEQAEILLHRSLASAPTQRLDLAWRAWQGLAQVAQQRGTMHEALDAYQQAIQHLNHWRRGAVSTAGAAHLAAESRALVRQAVAAALNDGQDALALTWLEEQKATQLMERLGQTLRRPTVSPPSPQEGTPVSLRPVMHKLQSLRTTIQQARLDEDWEKLSVQEEEFERVTRWVEAMNAPYAGLFTAPPLRLSTLRARLDERHGPRRWGCLAYGWLEARTGELYVFWLDSSEVAAAVVPLNALDLHLVQLACRSEASYRRRFLHWPAATHPPAEWQRLEALLLPGSLRDLLSGVETVYLAPSGPLVTFPFAALRVAHTFWGLQARLSQVPSLPFLAALIRRTSDRSRPMSSPHQELAQVRGLVCSISHTPGHPGVGPLPAVAEEAAALLAQLGPHSLHLADDQATVAAWQKLAAEDGLAAFQLLHFASHVRLHPSQAYLSHLLLSDGVLYTPDILQWHLQADAVVLAACDTAVGQVWAGDEQMGMAHAFLTVGADTVVATLWPVADAPTAAFFRRFYAALAAGAPGYAAGLLAARRQTAAQEPQPFAWAAFVQLGLA